MTAPIARNSPQEKEVQAEKRKILSVTSLQSQLQRIRRQREAQKEKEEEEENELERFNEFVIFTKSEFEKVWGAVYASEKKNNLCTRRE